MRTLKKQIRRDCRRSMFPTVSIYVLRALTVFAATAFLAELLGDLANAVFSLDAQSAPRNILLIAVCVLVNGVAAPLMEIGANAVMLANALSHDRLVFARWLGKDYLSAMSVDRGEIEDRIEMDPINYRIYWVNSRQKLISAAITLIPLLCLVLRIHPVYGVICVFLAVFRIFVPKLAAKRSADLEMQDRDYSSAKRRRESELTSFPCEMRLLGLGDAWREMLLKGFEDYYFRTVKKKSLFISFTDSGREFVKGMIDISVIMVGAVFVAQKAISPGGVAAMLGYFGLLSQIADSTAEGVVELAKLKGFEERMELFYENFGKKGGVSLDTQGAVSLSAEGLSLSYGKETVFSGLDFNVPYGQKTAVIGANGSGKTSLIRLICGLLEPTEGSLRVNGTEILELDPQAWRKCIAVAMQDPWIACGTVRENVGLGNSDITESELDEILKTTGLWELRDRSAKDKAEPLSGGEKQRISIARALARCAPLLILDEPTNHMDTNGIEMVENILAEYPGTVLVVTHDKRIAAMCRENVRL